MIDVKLILDIIAAAGAVIIGGIAIFGIGDKAIKGRHQELDSAEGKLIDTLKVQVEVLDRKVNEQAKMIDAMKKQMDTLVQENTTLNKVLQGRDIETVESIKRTKEILELAKQNSKSIERLYKVIEKYLSQDKK